MQRFMVLWCWITMIGVAPVFGQGVTSVGAGYANPSIRVAPGQITTIFATGLNPDLSQPQTATTVPLQDTLAGISVTICQSSLKQSLAAPLQSVQQIDIWTTQILAKATPECQITAITLQIPCELSPDPIGSVPGNTEFAITTNETLSNSFPVLVETDAIHVLNVCDTFSIKTRFLTLV
jgi:uncharacterized protein (TIGR03437 family)